VLLGQIILVLVVVFLWEKAPAQGVFDPFYISRPSLIFNTLWTWATTGKLWENMLITLTITLAGFLIGGVLGFACGALLGINKWLGRMLTPFVTALQSVPRLALVPLFILWFGIGVLSKLALVATVVFFLVFMATRAGVAAVDEQLTNTLRIMRAKPWQVHTKATLPSAMIWITEGLRVSIPWALVATVTAEILSSNEGLGYLLARSAGQFFTAGVFAAIFVLTVLGVLLTYLVTLMERRLLAWKRAAQH
jgi:NitT/TauT family transport system permease protein